jgi:OOP family OmpA-OmpF porin
MPTFLVLALPLALTAPGCASAPRPQPLIKAQELVDQKEQQKAAERIAPELVKEARALLAKAEEAHDEGEPKEAVRHAVLAELTYRTALEQVAIAEAKQRLADGEERADEASGQDADDRERLSRLAPQVERMERIASLEAQQQASAEALRAQKVEREREQERAQLQGLAAVVSSKLDTATALSAQDHDPAGVKAARKQLEEARKALGQDHEKARALLAEADSAVTNAIAVARKASDAEASQLNVLKEREALLARAAQIAEVEAVQTQGSVVVTLRRLFAPSKSEVVQEHFSTLQALAKLAKDFERYPLLVAAHTDSHGSDRRNLDLSTTRARAVADYLMREGGLPPDRITASGYGEAKPIASNNDKDGRAKNRRVEIIFVFR